MSFQHILAPSSGVVLTETIKENLGNRKSLAKCPDYNQSKCDFYRVEDRCQRLDRHTKIYDSILDLIGETPMIRLSRLEKKFNLEFELCAKCEYMNPGGSIKDRIGLKMIEEAESTKRIKPGDILIEGTSGNTAIGLNLVSLIKGYKNVIVMPQKMSHEKNNIIKALGAEVIRTPTEAAWNSPESHLSTSYSLATILENAIVLDQYKNSANPRSHYLGTGDEILQQCDKKVDYIFCTVGTGGTISGLSRRVKEILPNCQIIGVDPYGSILARPHELNDYKKGQSYVVEGIGYDFIPSVLIYDHIDNWVKTDDQESFCSAREIIRTEGLLVGGSSGACLAGLLKMAHTIPKGSRCVLVFSDSSRNYISRFVSDDWMKQKEFYPCKGEGPKLQSILPIPKAATIDWNSLDIKSVLKVLSEKNDCVLIKKNSKPYGIINHMNILQCYSHPDQSNMENIASIIDTKLELLNTNMSLELVALKLKSNQYCLIEGENDCILTPSVFVNRIYANM